MSLKAFHIFFIAVSVLFCLGFGYWGLDRYGSSDSGGHLALAVGSFLSAVGLVVYGFWFLRKLKKVSFL